MRGRTLNDSFVILDEAQNTTTEQMKMFLTRLGFDSKAVVTGDVTQIDLPHGQPSGPGRGRASCSPAFDGIAFVHFNEQTSSAIRWCSASSSPTTGTTSRRTSAVEDVKP